MENPFSLWVFLSQSPLLWLTVTLLVYTTTDAVSAATRRHPLANPVLHAMWIIALFLVLTGTSYSTYFAGAQFVHFLLGPATVALAVPLYQNRKLVTAAIVPMLLALISGLGSDPPNLLGGSFVTISSGSVPEGKALFELGNPFLHPIRPPVSQFIFTAFDWSLDIDTVLGTLESVLGRMADGVTKMITEQCEAGSARSGVELAQLLAPLPIGNFALVTEIEFSSPPAT